MARTARTDSLPGAGRSSGAGEATAGGGGRLRALRRPAERLWHLLTSMRVALLVILALAALALVGTVLVQAPAGALADPEAKASWLETIRPRYGGLTPILEQLGLFTIFESPWFRALAAYLAVSLVACVIHRVNRIWHVSVRPTVTTGQGFFEQAPWHEAIAIRQGPGEALEPVRQAFHRRRYRTLVEDDGTVHLYADRNRWGPLGSLAGHLGLLVILAGAVIGSAFGFSEPRFVVAEGSREAVPTRSGLSLELVAFRDAYYPTTGAPSDFASDLVLYQDGREVARKTVRVNDPLRYEGLSFYQSDYGPAAVVSVRDASGATTVRESVALTYLTEEGRRLGSLDIPEASLTAVLAGTSGTDDAVVRPGQMLLMLYSTQGGSGPVAEATLDQGTPTEVDGLTFTFERESQYVSLKIASDPGTPLVWLGCILLVAGFAVGLLLPHRRIWGRLVARPAGGTTVSIASIHRTDVSFDAEFTGLVDGIRGALDAPGRS